MPRDAPAPSGNEESVIAADYDPGSIIAGHEPLPDYIPHDGPIWTVGAPKKIPKQSFPKSADHMPTVQEPSQLVSSQEFGKPNSGTTRSSAISSAHRNPNTNLSDENDRLAKQHRRSSKEAPAPAPQGESCGESARHSHGLRSSKKKRASGGAAMSPGAVPVDAEDQLQTTSTAELPPPVLTTADYTGNYNTAEEIDEYMANRSREESVDPDEEWEEPAQDRMTYSDRQNNTQNQTERFAAAKERQTLSKHQQQSISTITQNRSAIRPPRDVEEGPDPWSSDVAPSEDGNKSVGGDRKYYILSAVFCLLILGAVGAVIGVTMGGGRSSDDNKAVVDPTQPPTLPPTTPPPAIIDASLDNDNATGDITAAPNEEAVATTLEPTTPPLIEEDVATTQPTITTIAPTTISPTEAPAIAPTTHSPTEAPTDALNTSSPTVPATEAPITPSPTVPATEAPTDSPTQTGIGIGVPMPETTTIQPTSEGTDPPQQPTESGGIGIPIPSEADTAQPTSDPATATSTSSPTAAAATATTTEAPALQTTASPTEAAGIGVGVPIPEDTKTEQPTGTSIPLQPGADPMPATNSTTSAPGIGIPLPPPGSQEARPLVPPPAT